MARPSPPCSRSCFQAAVVGTWARLLLAAFAMTLCLTTFAVLASVV